MEMLVAFAYVLDVADLPLGEENLVPDDFHAFLGVHGEIRCIDTWNVTLSNLEGNDGNACQGLVERDAGRPTVSRRFCQRAHGLDST